VGIDPKSLRRDFIDLLTTYSQLVLPCVPYHYRRCGLKVLDISPRDDSSRHELQLELDAEWLCILRSTNHLLRLTKAPTYMPGPGAHERCAANSVVSFSFLLMSLHSVDIMPPKSVPS